MHWDSNFSARGTQASLKAIQAPLRFGNVLAARGVQKRCKSMLFSNLQKIPACLDYTTLVVGSTPQLVPEAFPRHPEADEAVSLKRFVLCERGDRSGASASASQN